MTPEALNIYRPADNTAAVIEAALSKIDAAKAAAEQARSATADAGEVAELDATIRQLAALREEIQPQPAAARRVATRSPHGPPSPGALRRRAGGT